MIHFKNITIEGFGSFLKPFSYVLEGPGIHIISGKNGAGKTTIFSALCWCLFDKPLKSKDVTPWNTPKDFKGTKVTVEFTKNRDKHYKVVRTKNGKRNQVFLYDGGVYIQKLRDKKDIQGAIEEILGVSFNLFKNSIVFGQNLTRLMRESGPQQKKVFDEAFEVTYLNLAKDKASKELYVFQKESQESYAKVENLTSSILSEERTLKAHQESEVDTKELIKNLKAELLTVSDKITNQVNLKKDDQSFDDRLNRYLGKIKELEELENQHFKLDFRHEQENAETQGLKQECKKLKEALARKNPLCPHCGQVVDSKNLENHRIKIIQDLEQKQHEYNQRLIEQSNRELELNNLTSSIKTLSKYRELYKKLNNQLREEKYNQGLFKELESSKINLKFKINKHKESLISISSKIEESQGRLSLLKEKLLKVEATYVKAEKQQKLHKWLIDDPLSNKGIKAFIFDAMLSSINDRLEYYGSYTGNVVKFIIDLDSGNKNFETLISESNITKYYEELSGGEQQLVDIALAFSIHDVITQHKNFNILLMDEIFEALDVDNIELVSNLLSIKAKDTAIHLITHQQSMVFSQVACYTNLKRTKNGTIAV